MPGSYITMHIKYCKWPARIPLIAVRLGFSYVATKYTHIHTPPAARTSPHCRHCGSVLWPNLPLIILSPPYSVFTGGLPLSATRVRRYGTPRDMGIFEVSIRGSWPNTVGNISSLDPGTAAGVLRLTGRGVSPHVIGATGCSLSEAPCTLQWRVLARRKEETNQPVRDGVLCRWQDASNRQRNVQ